MFRNIILDLNCANFWGLPQIWDLSQHCTLSFILWGIVVPKKVFIWHNLGLWNVCFHIMGISFQSIKGTVFAVAEQKTYSFLTHTFENRNKTYIRIYIQFDSWTRKAPVCPLTGYGSMPTALNKQFSSPG